ncbi:MAG: hypothetical protein AABX71_02265, partial [Nanoarchaeota archaeon]
MKNKLMVAVLISLLVISVVVSAVAEAPVKEKNGLERIDLIHYAKPENPGKPGKTETCYKLLGVK